MQAADGRHPDPRFCAIIPSHLSIVGACRVCLVEVEGQRNPVASCSFPVAEGMKVTTSSVLLRRLRRDIVELILDNHPRTARPASATATASCRTWPTTWACGAAVRGRAQALRRSTLPRRRSSQRREVHPLRPLRARVRRGPGRHNLSSSSAASRRGGAGARGRHDRLGLHPLRPVRQRLPDGRLRRARQHRRRCSSPVQPGPARRGADGAPIRAAIGEGFGFRAGHAGGRQAGHGAAAWGSRRCSTPTSARTSPSSRSPRVHRPPAEEREACR
jgi:hypothetical protein